MKLLITGGGGFVGAAPRPRPARPRPPSTASAIERTRARPTRSRRRRPTCSPIRPGRGPHRPAARPVPRRCATSPSTAYLPPRLGGLGRMRSSTSTSACAPTSTAPAPCSMRCGPERCTRGRNVAAAGVLEFGGGVRARRRRCRCLPARRRRHAAGPADLLRHAEAHLRAPRGSDYTRKGYVDGRAARLMTVTVRPGRPNGAASSFFSGIIREPLAGVEAICPVVAPACRIRCRHRRAPSRG